MSQSVLSRYLDPEVLGQVADRSITPQGLVIGNLAGAHKSPLSGFAVEFAGHREYVPAEGMIANDDDGHVARLCCLDRLVAVIVPREPHCRNTEPGTDGVHDRHTVGQWSAVQIKQRLIGKTTDDGDAANRRALQRQDRAFVPEQHDGLMRHITRHSLVALCVPGCRPDLQNDR